MKFGTMQMERGFKAVTEDAVSAATEALVIGQDLIEASGSSKELMDVVANIAFIRDYIKTNGLKASFHMSASVKQFAETAGLEAYQPGMDDASAKLLEAKYVEAATESIKEMWNRFLEAIKTLWTKLVAWIKTTFSMRNVYLGRIKDKLAKFDGFDSEASVKSMKKDDLEACIKVVSAFHDVFKASAASRLPEVNGVAIPFFANPDDLVDAFDACGFTLSMNGGNIEVSAAGRTLDDLYPVRDLLLPYLQQIFRDAGEFCPVRNIPLQYLRPVCVIPVSHRRKPFIHRTIQGPVQAIGIKLTVSVAQYHHRAQITYDLMTIVQLFQISFAPFDIRLNPFNSFHFFHVLYSEIPV